MSIVYSSANESCLDFGSSVHCLLVEVVTVSVYIESSVYWLMVEMDKLG